MIFNKITESCNYHHNLVSELFFLPQKIFPMIFVVNLHFYLQPLKTVNLLTIAIDLPFWTFHINGIHIICGLWHLASFT